ncbi:MAG: hypothetical protein NDJ90_06370 [Oligoflexia bacterium]|nr:hypothetical protein [Oligoflexia bacterium]
MPSGALAAGGGEYAPVMGLGFKFFNGDTGKSLTGAQAYGLHFRAEKRRGWLRTFADAEFEYSGGTASVGTESPTFSLYGGGFLGGANIFVFTTGRFQAFFGGAGVLAWHMLKLTPAPSGVEPNTQGLSFGYEVRAGVDMRLGSADGNAIRLESGYSAVTSRIGGQSGFQLAGFKFVLGLVY